MTMQPYTKEEIYSIIEKGPTPFDSLIKGKSRKVTPEKQSVRESCNGLINEGLVLLVNIGIYRYYILNTEEAKRVAILQQIEENSRYDKGTGCIVWRGTYDSKRGPVMNQKLANPASAVNVRRWIYSDSTGRELKDGTDSVGMRSQCVHGCINKDHMTHHIVNESTSNRKIMGEVRSLLREEEDGLNVSTIAKLIRSDTETVRDALKAMPDAYIDRYEAANRGKYASVWCVVKVPEHCPHPKLAA